MVHDFEAMMVKYAMILISWPFCDCCKCHWEVLKYIIFYKCFCRVWKLIVWVQNCRRGAWKVYYHSQKSSKLWTIIHISLAWFKTPLSFDQLNQRLDWSLEKITHFREEAKLIVTENPSLEMVSFNPVEFFKQLTSFQDQSLLQFEDNAETLTKMLDIAAKATKQEMEQRINQRKIDKLHEKIALRIKLQSKNQASKARKRNWKIESVWMKVKDLHWKSQTIRFVLLKNYM